MAKRIFSIMIVALLIVGVCSVFAACGEDTKTEATVAPTAAPAADAPVADTDDADDADEPEDTDDGDAPAEEATSAPYDGETVITDDEAIEFVQQSQGYTGDEGYTFTPDGCIVIPDGSVWHSVLVYNADGEMEASFYVSDTTGTVKTTTEMMAYAYRD